VEGLELVAESAGGRRNRIDTVLVSRVTPDEAGDASANGGRTLPEQAGAPSAPAEESQTADA
jgi:hypothetical protein